MKIHRSLLLGLIPGLLLILTCPVASHGGEPEPAARPEALDVQKLADSLLPRIEALRGRRFEKPVTVRLSKSISNILSNVMQYPSAKAMSYRCSA